MGRCAAARVLLWCKDKPTGSRDEGEIEEEEGSRAEGRCVRGHVCRGSHTVLRSTAIPPGIQRQVGHTVGTQHPFLPCCRVPGHAAEAAKLKSSVAQTPS